jgi:fatty acid desaturase (delta-4 desaturase)
MAPQSVAKQAPAGVVPTVSRSEVAARRHDLFIVGDRVYSAAKFRWEHPGGAVFVSMFGGRDATLAFQSYHSRAFPHADLTRRGFFEAELDGDSVPVVEDAAHRELAALVKPVLARRGGSFAPTLQLFKMVMLVLAALAVEWREHFVARTWTGSFVLGLLFAWIGLNVQHDANHGAASRRGWVNALLGLSQDWIGGSSLMWMQEHVVLHHLHTNDVAMDPDVQGFPVLRLHPDEPSFAWHALQHLYIFALEMGFGVVPVFGAFFELLAWRYRGERKWSISRLAIWPWGVVGVALHVGFYARFFVLPFCIGASASDPFWATAGKIALTISVGGGYLAFFFFLSHNFEGVHFVDGAEEVTGSCVYPAGSSFVHQQAASSCNVGGATLAVFNGGLNYQIEHHLFPRVAHSHYPHIAPVVRKFCEARGIPYVHFETIGANLASVKRHLRAMADDATVPVVSRVENSSARAARKAKAR